MPFNSLDFSKFPDVPVPEINMNFDNLLLFGRIAEQKRKQGIEDYEAKKRIDSKYSRPSSRVSSAPKKDYTDQDLATIYLRYNEQYDESGNVRGYKDYTSSEQKSLASNAKKHPQTMIHYTLLQQGYSPMLVEDIMKDIDETLAKDIIEGYASDIDGEDSLYDYIMQYLSYETTSDKLGLGEGYQPFFLK